MKFSKHCLAGHKYNLAHLEMLAKTDFDEACDWAENNVPALRDYFDTWASHCGASRKVFIGHTIKMLIDIDT